MVNDFIKTWSHKAKVVSIIILPILWSLCLFIFTNITSPLQNGPMSVLAVFTLIYLIIESTLYLVVLMLYKILQIFGRRLPPLERKQTYYFVSVIALAPVFILALNTLGKLDVKEVLLVVLLVAVGCFYVLRMGRKTPR